MKERISIKPDICNGRPVVRGTRIAVQTVLEFLAAGDSVEDLLEEYPKLTRADVRACLSMLRASWATIFLWCGRREGVSL